MTFQRVDSGLDFIAGRELLIADGWRSHAAHRADQRIVWQVISADNRNSAASLAQFFFQSNPTNVSTAAAARAKDAGADGNG